MSTGKISAAIGCLPDKKTKGVFHLNEVIEGKTVLSILKEKLPQAKTAKTNYITEVSEDTMPYHHSIFEQINGKTVRKSTLKTHGSHGPSGLDGCEWGRILTHFNQTSIELCKTIAKLSYIILLIDAENAFNSLNREFALENVEIFCPALHHALANSYKHPSTLYVKNTVLTSTEGTTQGDPLAMATYGIGII